MDNVTHTLAGILIAEGAIRLAGARGPTLPRKVVRASYFVSIVANNLPDLDFAYAGITEGRLGYLLHHRGHTHTVAAALLNALVFTAAFELSAARRWWLERNEWRVLAALAAVGPFAHLLLDFTNNYGVHPFWPVSGRWFYGDSVFIVEPLLWAASIPPTLLVLRARVGRALLALLLLGSLVLAGVVPMVPWPAVVLLVVVACVFFAVAFYVRAERRLWLAIAGWLGVTLAFTTSGMRARAAVLAEVGDDPNVTTHDVVLTPFPANPLCWTMIAVQTTGDRYVLRAGAVAPEPWLVSARDCPRGIQSETTAPLARLPKTGTVGVHWEAEFSAPLSELRKLAASNCHAQAFLRFGRAPFWTDAAPRILGDLRYDRESGHGFAEVELPTRPLPCPANVPPWTPPRADILRIQKE